MARRKSERRKHELIANPACPARWKRGDLDPDELQAAVAHFVDLAVCYQVQGAEVSDLAAKKLIGGIANAVLRHLQAP